MRVPVGSGAGGEGSGSREQNAFLTNQTLEFGFKKARGKSAGIRFEAEE